MNRRVRLLFWIGYLSRFWIKLLVAPVLRFIDRQAKDPTYDGIRIVGLLLDPEMQSNFVARTSEALALIKARDPRRFRRIKREIRSIVSMSLSPGSYTRPWRQCNIDFRHFDFASNPESALQSYCCVLVHEATHGHLYSRYINYDEKSRERIERLCRKEEGHFARRAFPDTWNQWFHPFDPADWHSSWHASRREKRARAWKKLKEIWQHRNGASVPAPAPAEGSSEAN